MDKIQRIQDDISRTKAEIGAILERYEARIKSKINELDEADELSRESIIKELFVIKDEIYMATNQYSYPFNEFLTSFINNLDQKNEPSIDCIVNKMKRLSDTD